jgi:predicted HicB family RNase H-like nuclease
MLTYKGYRGHFELDAETGLFHGEVLDTRDVITFQGTSVEELTQAFHDSIDDYLEFCSSTLSGCRPGRGLPPLRG